MQNLEVCVGGGEEIKTETEGERDWKRQEYEREVCAEVRGCGIQVTRHRRRDYLVLRRKETNMRREAVMMGGGGK